MSHKSPPLIKITAFVWQPCWRSMDHWMLQLFSKWGIFITFTTPCHQELPQSSRRISHFMTWEMKTWLRVKTARLATVKKKENAELWLPCLENRLHLQRPIYFFLQATSCLHTIAEYLLVLAHIVKLNKVRQSNSLTKNSYIIKGLMDDHNAQQG